MAQLMGPDSLAGRALSLGGARVRPLARSIFNTPAMHAAEIPAANGITNAASLSRMYAACVSEVDGIRLLTPETVAKVSETQTSGPDQVLMLESTFGLGFMTPGIMTPMLGSSSFGHAGRGRLSRLRRRRQRCLVRLRDEPDADEPCGRSAPRRSHRSGEGEPVAARLVFFGVWATKTWPFRQENQPARTALNRSMTFFGLGDELVHELGGGHELVDRTDTLAAREELAVDGRPSVCSSPPRWLTPAWAEASICCGNGSSSSGCSSKCWVHSLRTTRHVLPVYARETTVPSSAVREQRVLVAGHRAGFGCGDESGTDPDAVGAERERGGEPTAVEQAARGDDGHAIADGVDDLGHERHRRNLSGVTARFGALRDDEVAPASTAPMAWRTLPHMLDDEDVVGVAQVDHVARHAESGDEDASAAVDHRLHLRLHLRRERGEQVDAERLRR